MTPTKESLHIFTLSHLVLRHRLTQSCPAALRFQPAKRPQQQQQQPKPKPRQPAPKPSNPTTSSSTGDPNPSSDAQPQPLAPPQPKTNLAAWAATASDDEDAFAYAEQQKHQQRRGRKAKRKRAKQEVNELAEPRETNWDEIYDPSRPTNYEEYKGSSEMYRDAREWREKLFRARRRAEVQTQTRRSPSDGLSDDYEDERSRSRFSETVQSENKSAVMVNGMIAGAFDSATGAYNFAPPPDLDDVNKPPSPPAELNEASAARVEHEASGEDAYARRLALSGLSAAPEQPSPPPDEDYEGEMEDDDEYEPQPPPTDYANPDKPAQPAPFAPGLSQAFPPDYPAPFPPSDPAPGTGQPPPPPPPDTPATGTISRAPVRYNLPPAPPSPPPAPADAASDVSAPEAPPTEKQDQPQPPEEQEQEQEQDEEQPRSRRPGQKGFAERLMAKYGWSKGQGLGAEGNEGIVNPLRMVQADKKDKKQNKRKRPVDASDEDEDGGGGKRGVKTTVVGTKGKIVGGKKSKAQLDREKADAEKGALSEVVVLMGMLAGVGDVKAEIETGGLVQEVGEECADKYGLVERVFIDRDAAGDVPVFVKFTSQLSALRAVNALEGRVFNGSSISAKFFDADRFEKGDYEI